MPLSEDERARTGRELAANAQRSGLTAAAIARALGFNLARLESTLHVSPSCDSVDVWMLRDFLDQAVVHAGDEPEPYSVLTEDNRRRFD